MNDKKRNRTVIIIVSVLLAFLMLSALIVGIPGAIITSKYTEKIGHPDDLSPENSYPYAMVLGAKVNEDGTLSLALRNRMDKAISLYQQGLAEKLLLSGGKNDKVNEPLAMKAYALANGVKEEDILLDEGGFSTYESVTRLQTEFGIDRCILVSQYSHLSRAVYIAENSGIDAFGVIADDYGVFGFTKLELHELFARAKDFYLCHFDHIPA